MAIKNFCISMIKFSLILIKLCETLQALLKKMSKYIEARNTKWKVKTLNQKEFLLEQMECVFKNEPLPGDSDDDSDNIAKSKPIYREFSSKCDDKKLINFSNQVSVCPRVNNNHVSEDSLIRIAFVSSENLTLQKNNFKLKHVINQ